MASVGLSRTFKSEFGFGRIRKGSAQMHREVNAYIAHMAGVKKAVGAQGREIEGRAKANLAQHRDTGAARITFHREDTDAIISLVDEAAVSIEWGREAGIDITGRRKGAMQGLHIIARAAGI